MLLFALNAVRLQFRFDKIDHEVGICIGQIKFVDSKNVSAPVPKIFTCPELPRVLTSTRRNVSEQDEYLPRKTFQKFRFRSRARLSLLGGSKGLIGYDPKHTCSRGDHLCRRKRKWRAARRLKKKKWKGNIEAVARFLATPLERVGVNVVSLTLVPFLQRRNCSVVGIHRILAWLKITSHAYNVKAAVGGLFSVLGVSEARFLSIRSVNFTRLPVPAQ
ncbi:hypothetical protein K0M31_017191 [Melipona bicolor]|uniref:Uncharacterized protein n=1 Tax=Melipona bicolor TaxID=60889 RepID=A0AA40KS75_9HYME|nr:hypothetical protein K0M31_017191 [Melipona bicolor]